MRKAVECRSQRVLAQLVPRGFPSFNLFSRLLFYLSFYKVYSKLMAPLEIDACTLKICMEKTAVLHALNSTRTLQRDILTNCTAY
jgi:hypothetical protein